MQIATAQIQKRLKTPENAAAITDAIKHENRIRLHAESIADKSKASPYYFDFLEWVRNGIMLPAEKYAQFEAMCEFPLVTTASVSMIQDEYEKIFDANDANFSVNMRDDSMKQDFLNYLDTIKIHEFFKRDVFEAYKIRPNTILVIDLPVDQVTQWPEPFVNKIAIESVHDIVIERNVDGTDKIGLLIYRTDDRFDDVTNTYIRRFVVIDDRAYQLWEERKAVDNEIEHVLISEAVHGLNFCPATFIPSARLYSFDARSTVARKVTLSASLFDLNWLLWYITAKRVYETYGPFPIATVPKEENENCTDDRCVDGTLHIHNPTLGDIVTMPCPACAKRKQNSLVGPGTTYEMQAPRSSDDPEFGPGVHFTHPETTNLEYIAAEIDRLEWKLYENNVGDNNEMITKQAVNEEQVHNSTRGKENLFLKLAKDFEQAEKFVINTMGLLRYGNWYVSCERSYGQEFLLYTVADLQDRYALCKKNGLPMHMIAYVRQLLAQTEHKNNSYQRLRVKILDLLEPWIDLTLAECVAYQYHLIFPDLFTLKVNFQTILANFELSNGDIIEWGAKLNFDKKIQLLTEIFKEDAKKINTGKIELPTEQSPAQNKSAA